ncbi:F0F1 ATP synthase subunit B [Candidatus Daviesbacteria bacterium]|nr:F0F1 ATP synthase subunit B [Candidatus Daviesbacteria bacterium]
MEQILKDFGIQPFLLAAQVVNFLILLLILKKFLYKPILRVLDERKSKIAQSLEEAAQIEKNLLKTEEDREKILNQAGIEAKQLIALASKSADEIISQAHQKAALDMQGILKKGEETIRLEKMRMQQEIREELGDLVVVSLQKIVGKVLNKKDQKEMINKSIKEM